MLTPQDEFAHEPQPVTNWQENYVWHAWSSSQRCGWNLHLGRIVSEGIVDVRAHVVIDGQVTAATYQTPGDDCLAANGLEVEVLEPMRRMRMRFRGSSGSRGPDDAGWFGRKAGDVPFGFDIELESFHAPFDAASHPEMAGNLDQSGNHYELGATWRGTVSSGGATVEASGLLVRDHSWGGRGWKFDDVYWIPMVFPDERQYAFNVVKRVDTRWENLTVTMGEDGVLRKSEELWVRVHGASRPRQFSAIELLAIGDGFQEHSAMHGEIHIPVARTHSGKVGLSDMYSRVTSAGRTGFATVQTFPTESEVLEGFRNPLDAFR